MLRILPILLLGISLSSCQGTSSAPEPHPATNRPPALQPDLPVSASPFEEVHVNWKQRLDQPYVYVERRGSYTAIGDALEEVWRGLREQGIEASGPPFALYYDDPAETAIEELRLRACFPVAGAGAAGPPLASDVLESTTVVYAFVAGPYPEIPRAYPSLFAFLERLGWTEDGPIREIYLVNPALVSDPSQLVAEVQIPATRAR